MPSKGRPKIVVRLEPELLAELKAAVDGARPGKKAGDGLSGVVREALVAWLDTRQSPPAALPLAAQAKTATAPARTARVGSAKSSEPPRRVMQVELWLRVERNNKFVRGKKKARTEIEDRILWRYGMEKPDPDGWEYRLAIPYESDEELDRIIHEDILAEAEGIAEDHHCFTEADVRALDDPDRSW